MVNSVKKSLKRAFTITELVIVIAVIAILAAVLIPTLSNVVASANKSAALSTCRNALTDVTGIYADNGETSDELDGMVFVSNGYAYVFLNSALQYVGEIDDLAAVNADGTTKTVGKENIKYVYEEYETATIEVTKGYSYDCIVWGDTTIYFDSAVYCGYTSSAGVTYDADKTEYYAYTDTDDTHYYLGADEYQASESETKKGTDLSEKTAETLYIYEVELNGTTYVGFFTYESSNALYQTESATYSRLYSYSTLTATVDSETNATLLTGSDSAEAALLAASWSSLSGETTYIVTVSINGIKYWYTTTTDSEGALADKTTEAANEVEEINNVEEEVDDAELEDYTLVETVSGNGYTINMYAEKSGD